jgi:tetratricopeptide (TPR) repeat protein
MDHQETRHGHEGTQPYLPPVTPASVSTAQLPADVEPFIGRTAELSALEKLAVKDSDVDRAQVILIHGKRGVGKSALAVHFAHKIKKTYRDAQLFVSLGDVKPGPGGPYVQNADERLGDILDDFLRTLGVRGEAIPSLLSEKAGHYRSLVKDQSVLVVVDGVDSAAMIEPLIPASPASLVLLTGLSGLNQLSSAKRLQLDVLDMDSAVELLAATAGTEKVAKEPEAAREVALRCGSLPLAIKIAGARLATRTGWSVSSLAERLNNAKRPDGRSSVLDELQEGEMAVAASFSLSYEALTPGEQVLFRRLAAFRGPHFDDAAAASLVSPQFIHVATTLERFIDLKLLEPTTWNDCYRFHDLLREFAQKHFDADESAKSQRECYNAIIKYYFDQLRRADAALQPATEESGKESISSQGHDDQMASLRWLTRERENLVIVVSQALAQKKFDIAWKLAARLANFFEVRAHYDDWKVTHESVLKHLHDSRYDLGEATLTRSLGKLYYFQHDWEEAVNHYHSASQSFLRLGRDREVGVTLLYLGDAFRYRREWDLARNTLTAALDLLQKAGFDRGQAIALRSLGAVSRLTGDFDKALETYDHSYQIFKKIGDQRWMAATLLSRSDILIDQGRATEAKPVLEECLRVFQEYGDRHWQALTLRSLGDTHRHEGNLITALDFLEQSLVILREDGDRHWEAATIEARAEVYAAQGDWNAAVEDYNKCISMLGEDNPDRLLEARTRKNLGVALDALGDREKAKEQWNKAWMSLMEQNGQEAIEVHNLLRETS